MPGGIGSGGFAGASAGGDKRGRHRPGLGVGLGRDIRVCSQDARLGLTGVPKGEIPWDGGTQRLPRLVGPSWARDMILTGRTIDASQALAIGLVNRVEPRERLAPAADQLVQQMAEAGPVAARYAKEAITKGLDLTLSQGLGLEADLNVILQSTMDRAEGIRSFIERRSPRFTDNSQTGIERRSPGAQDNSRVGPTCNATVAASLRWQPFNPVYEGGQLTVKLDLHTHVWKRLTSSGHHWKSPKG